jgi:ABC-2 type transport system permease protein
MEKANTSAQLNDQAISDSINLKKVCAILMAGYVVVIVLFYFLAGEQLRFRDSRGSIKMTEPNFGTVELVSGAKVEQQFTAKIQRFKQVSITWGSYNRKNKGTVLVELLNLLNGSVLLSQKLDASQLTNGQVTTMAFDRYREDLCAVPMMIRITSDSTAGSAISPLMNTGAVPAEGEKLSINGKTATGVLSFSADGQDYIWLGLHYWLFVGIAGLLLLIYLIYILVQGKKGKKSLLLYALIAIKKYRFLIHQLVSRDFHTKYKRSVLGMFWSFLNPLLTMAVQYFVFSTIFKMAVSYYPVYLLTGIVMFNFFSESCGMALMSIIGNSSLITKVYVPKYIYPLTRVMSSCINLLISLIPLFAVALIAGVPFTQALLLFPFSLVCLTVFCLGLGMLLAAGMVFFRDVQFLWGVFSMVWMYATPIFYPESILPAQFKFILQVNPLYYFITFARSCIIGGVSPEPIVYIQCLLFAFVMFLIGALVFKKTQDAFILYI